MYCVKWVEMDEIYNYYPCFQIFLEYNKAKEYQADKEEEMEKQEEKVEELYDGKIISEIYLEEINLPEPE